MNKKLDKLEAIRARKARVVAESTDTAEIEARLADPNESKASEVTEITDAKIVGASLSENGLGTIESVSDAADTEEFEAPDEPESTVVEIEVTNPDNADDAGAPPAPPAAGAAAETVEITINEAQATAEPAKVQRSGLNRILGRN